MKWREQLDNYKMENQEESIIFHQKLLKQWITYALHHLINRIWNEEQIPDDW
jgi:hypothetical protein